MNGSNCHKKPGEFCRLHSPGVPTVAQNSNLQSSSTAEDKQLASDMEQALITLFELTFGPAMSNIRRGKTARTFGDTIEDSVLDGWSEIALALGGTATPKAGARSIYDCALVRDGKLYGFDVKTKDLDKTVYSDGGMCSVDNLLGFLNHSTQSFWLIEITHKEDTARGARKIDSITVAPFTALPESIYRVENLGSGQVRLNATLADSKREMKWERSPQEFKKLFVKLALDYYADLQKTTEERIANLDAYEKRGLTTFKAVRRSKKKSL